jgi:small multidrug resistance pump
MEITTDIESDINPVSRYYFPFSPNPLSRSVEDTIATDVMNGQHNGSSMRGLEETTATETADSTFDGMYKYWLLLLVTILFEVAGTTCMKLSDGFKNILPSIMIYVFYGASFAILPLALKGIDLSVGYAIWSGLGTTLTSLIGFYYFGDGITTTKIISLTAIIGGCVFLNFAGKGN